ncbi:ATP-binding protein [Devosia enhydra]|nr:ATP-binding protein [Devosia enhydra]
MTTDTNAGATARFAHHIRQRAPALLVAALGPLGFVVAGRIGAGEAMLAVALLGALVLALPVPARRSEDVVEGTSRSEGRQAALAIVSRFADTLVDPCLLVDHRGTIMHRNGAAGQQFGVAAPGTQIALGLRWPALGAAIAAVRETGAPASAEIHLTVPNETWYALSVMPLPEGSGVPAGVLVITLRDLTPEKRIDALRTDFIANASHELRTPLTSLMGFIDTLLGPAARDAAARERFLGIMRQQATRMSKLIDDLLSLSRIEMRQHMRPTDSVDLARLLADVRDGLETQAEQAGVAVALDIGVVPATVTGDRDELYEVFENLLENAIKYGGDGGRVELVLGRATRHGYDLVVSVEDHGPGIAAEHVPRLTERFYRVDADQSRKKKGTGLGLAIVKHIVARHRGVLTIRSTPGVGTKVEVLFPR